MPRFRLRLTAPETITTSEAGSSFYWLSDSQSTFTSSIGPRLGSLGPVLALNIDLVRIAVTVYTADRSVPRTARGSNWNRRSLELEVPVSDANTWTRVAPELVRTIDFLTGDRWKLSFNETEAPDEKLAEKTTNLKRVVLLSGGADSAIGALFSRADLEANEEHALVSHFSASTLAPIQRRIAEEVETALPGPKQHHLQIHFTRKKHRLDGSQFPTESSSRSRSLLFLALGLAVASTDGAPLWIPENGFASLNPPLGPERRGSLSTRTTHPTFLQGLSGLLKKVGAHGLIENPFSDSTKGEMFRRVARLMGDAAAAKLLQQTNSCAHTGQRSFGISPSTACGVCFGCMLRRASFQAGGLVDGTTYVDATDNARLKAWLNSKSVEPAIRSFVIRGVRPRDLIAMSLPPTYEISAALELCQRGVTELSKFIS